MNGGFPLFSVILPILNSGRVNLFGPNTPAITQEIRNANYNEQTFNSKLWGYGIDLKGSRDIYKLPAGMMALAVGVQAGREELTQNPNPLLQTGDVSGYGGNLQNISNSRTAWAVYGELAIPIVKTLEANVAVRYDHYSDFGNTTNPEAQRALDAGALVPDASLVGHRLQGADAVPAVESADAGPVAARRERSASLSQSGRSQQSRLQYAVHRHVRWQPGS